MAPFLCAQVDSSGGAHLSRVQGGGPTRTSYCVLEEAVCQLRGAAWERKVGLSSVIPVHPPAKSLFEGSGSGAEGAQEERGEGVSA